MNASLRNELKEFRHDTANLSELSANFKEMHLQLEGNEVNLITFVSKFNFIQMQYRLLQNISIS